jgi:maleylacetate reductase
MFGASSASGALHRVAAEMKAPLAMRDLGLRQAGLDRAAALATETRY